MTQQKIILTLSGDVDDMQLDVLFVPDLIGPDNKAFASSTLAKKKIQSVAMNIAQHVLSAVAVPKKQ